MDRRRNPPLQYTLVYLYHDVCWEAVSLWIADTEERQHWESCSLCAFGPPRGIWLTTVGRRIKWTVGLIQRGMFLGGITSPGYQNGGEIPLLPRQRAVGAIGLSHTRNNMAAQLAEEINQSPTFGVQQSCVWTQFLRIKAGPIIRYGMATTSSNWFWVSQRAANGWLLNLLLMYSWIPGR